MMTHSLAVLIVIAAVFAVAKKFRVSTELCLLLGAVGAVIAHVILPMGEDPRSALPFGEIIRHRDSAANNLKAFSLVFTREALQQPSCIRMSLIIKKSISRRLFDDFSCVHNIYMISCFSYHR